MKRAAQLIISLFWIVLPPLTAARAETVADFYRGKTIELAIAGAPAGGYDVAARTLANHYSRHIPGNPTVIVKNMPGAAGLVVTNYLYNVAKRDGTVIGMPTSNVPIEPRLKLLSPDGSNVKFDLGNFAWIGTPLQEPQVTWVWHTAPDVPTAIELATSDADKAMLRFYGLKFTMARPLLIPPQVPAERTAMLQAVFQATMQDPAYIEEARRIGLDTNWLGAKALAERVGDIAATPQAVVDHLHDLLARGGVK